MRLAIIIGHSSRRQGAVAYNGQSEWAWHIDLYHKYLCHHLPLITDAYEVFWRRQDVGYLEGVEKMVKEIEMFNPEMAIDLHFNAFDGKTAVTRTEALVLEDGRTSPTAKYFAKKYLQQMADDLYHIELDVKSRLLEVTETDRGYGVLKALDDKKIPCATLEPCFADVETNHSKAIIENPALYASVIAKVIAKVQGLD